MTYETFKLEMWEFVIKSIKSPKHLARYAKHKDKNVRALVGENIHACGDTLIRLSKDTEKVVLYAVAGNPSAPENVLVKFYEMQSVHMMRRLSKNRSLPYKYLKELSNHKDYMVRRGVAENQRATPDILEQRASDINA